MNALNNQRILGKHQTNGLINSRGRLIIAIPVVCFLASTLIVAGLRSKTIQLREQESHYRQIVAETERLTEALTDTEISIRAYTLTGDSQFLRPYAEAKEVVLKRLQQLDVLISQGSEQDTLLKTIQGLSQEQLALLETTLQGLNQVDSQSPISTQLTEQLRLREAKLAQLRSHVHLLAADVLEVHQTLEGQVLGWTAITTQTQYLALLLSLGASGIAIALFYQLEQKLLERANSLKESHLRQQAIFNSVVDGIVILDARGYIESWNAAAAQIFGYESTEIAGKHLQRLVKESFSDSGDALFYFLGDEHSKLYRFQEVTGRRKDGSTFPMELAISQLKLENQQFLITIVRDITERKEWEARLERQANLLDLANDTIIIKDLSDRILYWNQGAQRLYGWTASEALGQRFSRLIETQFPHAIEDIQADFLRKGEWKGELIQLNKKGQLLTVASSWTLQRDSMGQPIAHLEINKDITEAKAAEVALRKSEELYRTLVTNFPNGTVLLFDTHLTCTIAEGRGMAQMNLNADSIPPGKPLKEVLPASMSEQILPLCEQALTGNANVTEMAVGDRICQVHILPVTNEAGEVFSGLMMTQDITESKEAEKSLLRWAEESNHMNLILAQTTSILEKRNQELDQFAYVVSHDLKAPLRAIANLSSWIEEDLEKKLTPETKRQMELLRGRVYRMESLINGLLQYSRVGRIQGKRQPVNVGQIIQDVLEFLDPPDTIKVTIESEMPILNTQLIPLQQIFSNLISNAIKHRDRPEGNIVISVQDRGNLYEFSVSDDGLGIAPEYHSKIFIIFQTLQSRDKMENTGVGLAIVKKIIEDRGGKIWVSSKLGQGTTFYFTWYKNEKEAQ